MVRTMATENVDYECESTVCEYRGKKFSAKRNLLTHVRNIHGIDPSTGENTPTLYLCEVCGNELSAKSSLDRHLKVVHGIEPEAREKKFECSHCTVSYVTKKSLAHHVRLQHSVLTSPSEDSSTEDNSPDNKAKHLCSYCGKIYCKAYSLKQHVTKVHGIEEQKIPSSICSICDAHVRYGSDFSKHLKSEHDIEEDIEELSFSSMADFYQWKEKMEKETLSSYSKATSTRGSQQSLRHYFACHRSGERRTHGKGKRLFNAENSVKIGKLCPSRLIVSESGNGFFVIFHKSHVGHTNCLKYLRLTRSDKELIAGKLRNGIPKKQILKEIRSGVPSERIHAIDMLDIYNVIRDYNLDSDRAHPNDFVSLDMWVTQQQLLGSDCPIICYKKQGEEDETGELNTEDFLVVIMTPYQKMMLSKFTNFKVLMDSTHGTNAYDFQLTTVMIVDEFGAGVPIAFCISNKTDQSAMKRFLVAVRDAVGHRVMCQVFMSDDYPAYYNSWSQVMSVPNHKLLCSWHILRSWKNNLKKIRNDEKQVQVWQALIVILVELDEEIFHQLLEAFLEICSNDDELQSFHEYFSSKYAHSYEMWAFCYRKGLGLNTNMYLEAFHKKLKYCYLDGKINRRVDKCVSILLRFSKDMMYERFIRLVKGKPTMRMAMISESHKKSVLVKDEAIENVGEGSWRVQSSKAESRGPYWVNFSKTAACDGCPLSCHLCKVCIHQFTCTCVDHLIRGNFCKHIHACLRYSNLVDSVHTGPSTEEVKAGALCEEMEEMVMCLPAVGEEAGEVVDDKKKVKRLLEICIGATQSVDNPHLPRIIRSAERLMTMVHEALKNSESSSSHLNAPATRKRSIECQPRFFSTKKPRFMEKQSSKPTDEEILEWKNHLLGQ